jgi:hypothetical protein
MPINHLALPIEVSMGSYIYNEQDSQSEAKTQARAILSFPRGSRQESLDFGILDPTFQEMPVDVTDIANALAFYAPDLDIEITSRPHLDGTETINIRVALPFSDDVGEKVVS